MTAELYSMSTTLDELTRRVTRIAESFAAEGNDEVAGDLYGVERTLAGAHRRLVRVVDSQRP